MSLFLAAVLVCATPADDKNSPAKNDSIGPKEAQTTDEILKAIAPAVNSLVKPDQALKLIETVEFNRRVRRLFAAWYCPTSGRATCRVHIYQFDAKKQVWELVTEHFFSGTHNVSLELPHDNRLVIRDVHGTVISREEEK
jgi:hypothetical protein